MSATMPATRGEAIDVPEAQVKYCSCCSEMLF